MAVRKEAALPFTAEQEARRLLTVTDMARLIGCTERAVYGLEQRYLIPRAVRIGVFVRWRRAEVEKWLLEDCPSCRPKKK